MYLLEELQCPNHKADDPYVAVDADFDLLILRNEIVVIREEINCRSDRREQADES
jgi:hypothetical protein